VELLIEGDISYLSLQEPGGNSDNTRNYIQSTQSIFRQYGYEMLPTHHNIVIMARHTLHRNLMSTDVWFDGRIVSQVLKIQENQHMAILSVYHVCQGDRRYKDGVSKSDLRLKVANKSQICELMEKYPGNPIIVMGNLQERMKPEVVGVKSP